MIVDNWGVESLASERDPLPRGTTARCRSRRLALEVVAVLESHSRVDVWRRRASGRDRGRKFPLPAPGDERPKFNRTSGLHR